MEKEMKLKPREWHMCTCDGCGVAHDLFYDKANDWYLCRECKETEEVNEINKEAENNDAPLFT